MVEPLILNLFIKIKHHFVKINLQSPTESYQLITLAIWTWVKTTILLKVWNIELPKTFQ